MQKPTEVQADKIMSLAECAEFLGQSKRTVARWTRKAGLPYAQIEGGNLIFRLSKVVAWLDSKTNKK